MALIKEGFSTELDRSPPSYPSTETRLSDAEPPDLIHQLMANGFMLEVFMLQISLEMARTKDDPQAWARDFVVALQARIDGNEERVNDRRYPVHELARASTDRLGNALAQLLRLPPAART